MKISINKKHYNFNKNIKSKLVKLIGVKSLSLGFYKLNDILKISKNLKIDLLEVSSVKNLYSICKLIKFGRFEYFESKKNKKSWKLKNKKQKIFKQVEKEMSFHILIHANDYKNKKNKIIDFLSSGFNVKINIIAKGRGRSKKFLISDLINDLIYDFRNYGSIDRIPSLDKIDDNIFLYFSGKKKYYDKF